MTNPAINAPPRRGRNLGAVGSAAPILIPSYPPGNSPGVSRSPIAGHGKHTSAAMRQRAGSERVFIARRDGLQGDQLINAVRSAMDALAPVVVAKFLNNHN